ncbi:unnamed protein product [Protopolystoma xenopodis]|uniref:Uncharacterized protein n=1 Tax=Protopolystoma xenopodis TaxID=117903 RepID=A0A3S5BAP7_9PLAT|nr:unnamed protein product [Protopolystoma xenopodis]
MFRPYLAEVRLLEENHAPLQLIQVMAYHADQLGRPLFWQQSNLKSDQNFDGELGPEPFVDEAGGLSGSRRIHETNRWFKQEEPAADWEGSHSDPGQGSIIYSIARGYDYNGSLTINPETGPDLLSQF